MLFLDRVDAGRRLGELLKSQLRTTFPDWLFALPRGGVPVAREVARALGIPYEILSVKKLGLPSQPEFAIGALAEEGVSWVDEEGIERFGISENELEEMIRQKSREVESRVERYRMGRALPDLRGCHVILIDDGLATGATARAAALLLRRRGAETVSLAVPVAARDSLERLAGVFDDFFCVQAPRHFHAVGEYYLDFGPVEEEEVVRMSEELRGLHEEHEVRVDVGELQLEGRLFLPGRPAGLVLFAHGSGSSRLSPRNTHVARVLRHYGLASLLLDLLTPQEALDRDRVFDIPLLARRLRHAVRVASDKYHLPVALFGASTGAGAALWAAAGMGNTITSIVCRGGRPDLALQRLSRVTVPTLLIVGANDPIVVELNRRALAELRDARMEIVPRAGHLFEEPGTLDEVARLAAEFVLRNFRRSSKTAPGRGLPGAA